MKYSCYTSLLQLLPKNPEMSENTSAIKCENLSKHFGNVAALDNLNLTIDHGAVFGFLGPNGAGKTTTLRLLAGITNPTSGRVWVAGREVSSNSLNLRSAIGYLPESPAFYDWMTGREFLRFTGDLYGLEPSRSSTRTEELLERVNLMDSADRRVKTYSRGMQQRLGLAQALMNQPQILLLDEPASALDPMGRRAVLETIRTLKGETTIFLSTHILADVERVCDRVAIVNHGKLVTIGAIDELRAQQSRSLFEVEIEEDGAALANRLDNAPWISTCRVSRRNEHSVLHAEVSELEQAKRELPRLLMESNITLIRYELMSASLEDVFMELVGGQEGER